MTPEWITFFGLIVTGILTIAGNAYLNWRHREKLLADVQKTKAEERKTIAEAKKTASETAEKFAQLASNSADRIAELEARIIENKLKFEAIVKQIKEDFEAELEERDKLITIQLEGIKILTKQLVENNHVPDWQIDKIIVNQLSKD